MKRRCCSAPMTIAFGSRRSTVWPVWLSPISAPAYTVFPNRPRPVSPSTPCARSWRAMTGRSKSFLSVSMRKMRIYIKRRWRKSPVASQTVLRSIAGRRPNGAGIMGDKPRQGPGSNRRSFSAEYGDARRQRVMGHHRQGNVIRSFRAPVIHGRYPARSAP